MGVNLLEWKGKYHQSTILHDLSMIYDNTRTFIKANTFRYPKSIGVGEVPSPNGSVRLQSSQETAYIHSQHVGFHSLVFDAEVAPRMLAAILDVAIVEDT